MWKTYKILRLKELSKAIVQRKFSQGNFFRGQLVGTEISSEQLSGGATIWRVITRRTFILGKIIHGATVLEPMKEDYAKNLFYRNKIWNIDQFVLQIWLFFYSRISTGSRRLSLKKQILHISTMLVSLNQMNGLLNLLRLMSI